MGPFDDDQMFLRHLRQQIKDAQGGNLDNERLMQSLNRPSNMPSPFFTQTTPGNPGAFASPQPLNFPGSTMPKTTPGMPPSMPPNKPPTPFMMPQTPDPRLQNSPYSIPNLMGRMFGGGSLQPPQSNQPLSPQMQEFMKQQRPGIDPRTRQWDREDDNFSMKNFLLRAIIGQ